jgi:hypothetical protein
MDRKRILLPVLLVCFTFVAFAQQKDSVKVRLNHYSFSLGAGWTHYINNLENGDQNLKNNFVGFTGKFFWEPEYRLSLGLETGYFKLFKVSNEIKPDTTVEISRTVVPMLLLVRMRVVDNLHISAGVGLAFITNKSSGVGQEIVTKTTSLANFELAATYLYPLGNYWRVGGEAKIYRFGNLDDWMYSLQGVVAFRL